MFLKELVSCLNSFPVIRVLAHVFTSKKHAVKKKKKKSLQYQRKVKSAHNQIKLRQCADLNPGQFHRSNPVKQLFLNIELH
jgi:hypothetical protein